MSEKPQSVQRRKFTAAARQAARHLPPGLPPVFFLTDPARTPDPCRIAKQLPAGWGVIYRGFGAPGRLETAKRLAAVARQRRLVFLVAAEPKLAVACHADGVHWPFRLRAQARRWTGRFAMMTVSAHSGRKLRQAGRSPFDAALLSAVFASDSPSAGAPLGPLRLHRLARAARCPVYALGGLDAANSAQAGDSAGIASISGILRAFG